MVHKQNQFVQFDACLASAILKECDRQSISGMRGWVLGDFGEFLFGLVIGIFRFGLAEALALAERFGLRARLRLG